MEDQEWGAISEIMNKICEETDRLGDSRIVDICIEAVEGAEKSMSAEERFFGLYQFLFRFYYRIKRLSTKYDDFNIVYKDTRLENHKYVPTYRVVNYDYKMYQWARKKGFSDSMNNDYFLVPIDKLSEKEKENFEKKVKN